MRSKKYTSAYREKIKVTTEMYQELAEKQQFRCAVCSKFEWDCPSKRLCVDHDHMTRQVRGLLCHQCNVSLGLLKENKNIILNLLHYVSKHE